MEFEEEIDLAWIRKEEFGFRIGSLWQGVEDAARQAFRPEKGFDFEDSYGPRRSGIHWEALLRIRKGERLRATVWLSAREDELKRASIGVRLFPGWRRWTPFLIPRPLRRDRMQLFLRRAASNFRPL